MIKFSKLPEFTFQPKLLGKMQEIVGKCLENYDGVKVY